MNKFERSQMPFTSYSPHHKIHLTLRDITKSCSYKYLRNLKYSHMIEFKREGEILWQ